MPPRMTGFRLLGFLGLLNLALAAAGCRGVQNPGKGPVTAPDLPVLAVDHLEERALLLLLEDRRLYEPFTVERLAEGPPPVRAALARALGRIGDPRGRVLLEVLLADREVEVRRAAAFALGELAVPAPGGKEVGAVRALLRAAADPDRETGMLAVEALGKLGAPVLEVAESLAGLPDDGERWARLLPSLFRFQGVEVLPLAQEGLEVEDPHLHARAAYALARNPRPEAALLLRPLLGDSDPWVRGWAARALGQVGDREDLPRLQPLLADPEPGPVIQALRGAWRLVTEGKAAAPEEWREALLRLFEHPHGGVRVTALEAASAWLLDEKLGEALFRRAREDPGREGEMALVALAAGGDPRALDLVRLRAASDRPVDRARAAEAAGHLRAGEVLGQLARDPHPRVRAAVLEARLQAVPEEGARWIDEALTDPDAGVRAVAFQWLMEHPVLPLEKLEAALREAVDDRVVEARLNAVRALVARGKGESLERGGIVLLLEKLSEHPDSLVRREAASGLQALGRPRPATGALDTGRDLPLYREILQRTARERTVEIQTHHGALRLRLACPQAPLTCLNFLQLATQGFYDGLTFHRVVADFVVQGGDPRGDGWGGPGYTIRDEINRIRYRRGVVGMALGGPDTGGSQFFITLSEQPHLDGGYTAFGWVVAGEEVLDRIQQEDRIEGIMEVGGR